MKLPGYEILKEVTKKRLITLGEARKFFRTNFKDKRDFFALASLYTGGYVDCSWVREGSSWDMNKNSLVAEELYLMSLGPGKHNVEGVPEFINEQDYNVEFEIYCTAKADLFFHEQRSKRIERVIALSIAILVALVTAAATAYFTRMVDIRPGERGFGSTAKQEESVVRKPESDAKGKTGVEQKTTKSQKKAQPVVSPDRLRSR